jgi:regulator of protease activity HflC (stomatin/prohibitin superfamily)
MIESFLGALALMVAGYMIGSVRIVEEGDEALVQRLGQYQRTLKPGLNFVVPLVDTVLVETMREQLLDIEPQQAVTKDKAPVEVDAIIYWRIQDLYSAYYNVEELEESLKNIVLSTLRNKIGQMDLEDAISSIDSINAALRKEMKEATATWGVEVVRVEVQNFKLTSELQVALEKQIAAKAEGQAELVRTQATVKSIQALSEVLAGSADPQAILRYLISKDYVEANMEIGKGEGSKVLFMDPNSMNRAVTEMLGNDLSSWGDKKPPYSGSENLN